MSHLANVPLLTMLARRRAATLVFSTLVLVILFALAAFAIDFGYVVLTRSQLQSSADAAALAGTMRLMDDNRLRGTSELNQVMGAARDMANSFAARNPAAGVAPTMDLNNSNNPNGEIVMGRLNSSGELSTFGREDRFNAVYVRVQRSTQRNGPISTFFAHVIGSSSVELAAQAVAVYEGGVTGFRPTSDTGPATILPFTIHVDVWNGLVSGSGRDDWTYETETGGVVPGADGALELKFYPLQVDDYPDDASDGIVPGNFGKLSIGSDSGSAAFQRQIRNGISEADVAPYGGELKLDPGTGTLELGGEPGISSSIKDVLPDILGEARVIPLYSSVTGSGSNAVYTIVGFAGVRVMDFDLSGALADKYITLQPALVVDDSASANGGSTSTYVYEPLRLVRTNVRSESD